MLYSSIRALVTEVMNSLLCSINYWENVYYSVKVEFDSWLPSKLVSLFIRCWFGECLLLNQSSVDGGTNKLKISLSLECYANRRSLFNWNSDAVCVKPEWSPMETSVKQSKAYGLKDRQFYKSNTFWITLWGQSAVHSHQSQRVKEKQNISALKLIPLT